MSDMWTHPENDPRTYGNPVGERKCSDEEPEFEIPPPGRGAPRSVSRPVP